MDKRRYLARELPIKVMIMVYEKQQAGCVGSQILHAAKPSTAHAFVL